MYGKSGSKSLKLPSVRNCFTLAMTNNVICPFWLIPRRLSSNCRRFCTHCQFHLHRQVNEVFIHLPVKMEPTVSSEKSEISTQTSGNYPKRNKLHLEHGESLKTRMTNKLVVIIRSLKVPKINKILLYEMKFLLPNYNCLQKP